MAGPTARNALRSKARRAARVAAGLARPSTRDRYVSAVRDRLRDRAEPDDPAEICLVCGTGRPRRRTIRFVKDPTWVCVVRICRGCGHVGNPDNTRDYRNLTGLEKFPMRARVGTETRRGREFHMAKMAAQILKRDDLDVLVYGAGRSLDNRHIAGLPRVRDVAIGDVMHLRHDAEFVDITEPPTRRFPVVIACEVIEHFPNPAEEFPRLLDFVEENGLLVCSTNIYEGGDLERQRYVFIKGHTAYYTPEALVHIARANGFHVDFRVPLVATGYGSRRKRYVLFTRDASLLPEIACYFGRHMYAPSEGPWANKELAQETEQAEARPTDTTESG